jgi:hypothetical protein
VKKSLLLQNVQIPAHGDKEQEKPRNMIPSEEQKKASITETEI